MNEQGFISILLFAGTVIGIALIAGQQLAIHPIRTAAYMMGGTVGLFILYRGINSRSLTLPQTLFYLSFMITNLAVWSPLKAAAYITPIITFGLFIVGNARQRDARILNRLLILVFAWSALTMAYMAVSRSFSVQNSVIAFFTYSSFFPLLLIPSKQLNSPLLLRRMCAFLTPLLFIEAAIGIIQGCYGIYLVGGILGPFGDFVEGTLDLMPSPERSLNNAMYSFNLAMGILALIYIRSVVPRFWVQVTLVLCIISFILGSAIHLILVFFTVLLGCGTVAVLRRGRRRVRHSIVIVLVGIIMFSCIFVLLGKNMSFPGRFNSIRHGTNMKLMVFEEFWMDAEQDWVLYTIGRGPGQYGSRAALIAAGYLRRLPPGFSFVAAEPFQQRLLDKWATWRVMWWRSVTNSPASSLFAVLSEFGVLGLCLVAVWFSVFLAQVFRRCTSDNVMIAALLATGACMILTSGFVEHYWEIPQAIFMGCLLLKIFHALHFYPPEAPHAESGRV